MNKEEITDVNTFRLQCPNGARARSLEPADIVRHVNKILADCSVPNKCISCEHKFKPVSNTVPDGALFSMISLLADVDVPFAEAMLSTELTPGLSVVAKFAKKSTVSIGAAKPNPSGKGLSLPPPPPLPSKFNNVPHSFICLTVNDAPSNSSGSGAYQPNVVLEKFNNILENTHGLPRESHSAIACTNSLSHKGGSHTFIKFSSSEIKDIVLALLGEEFKLFHGMVVKVTDTSPEVSPPSNNKPASTLDPISGSNAIPKEGGGGDVASSSELNSSSAIKLNSKCSPQNDSVHDHSKDTEKIVRLERELGQLRKDLEASRTEARRISTQLISTQQNLAEQYKLVDDTRVEKENISLALNQSGRKISTLEAKNQEQIEQLKGLKTSAAAKDAEFVASTRKINDLEREVRNSEGIIASLQRERDSMQTEAQKTGSTLQGKISALELTVNEAKTSTIQKESILEQVSKQLAMFEESCKSLNQTVLFKDTQIASLERDKSDTFRRVTDLEILLQRATEEINAKDVLLRSAKTENADLVKQFTSEIENLKLEAEDRLKLTANMSEQLDQTKQQLLTYFEETSNLKAELTALKQKYEIQEDYDFIDREEAEEGDAH